jgi:hypothetical protein
MHQVGGPRWEPLERSHESAIIDHQRTNKEEDEYGSWDPLDPWASEGGRIYSTALNCLCMEVYYRYPRVFGTPTTAIHPATTPPCEVIDSLARDSLLHELLLPA